MEITAREATLLQRGLQRLWAEKVRNHIATPNDKYTAEMEAEFVELENLIDKLSSE